MKEMGKMVQLKKMDMSSTEKYRKYCIIRDKKMRKSICMCCVPGMVCVAVVFIFLVDSIEWIYLLITEGIGIVLLLLFLITAGRRIKQLEKEPESPYEYAVTYVKLDEKQELERENGEKVSFKVRDEKNNTLKDGQEVIAVYVPQCKQVFLEEVEKWKEIQNGEESK